MSNPAEDALCADPELTPSRWRVYWVLRYPFLNFKTPRDVKIDVLTEALRYRARTDVAERRGRTMGPRHIIAALDWLVRRGYLIERGRDARRVRSLMLEYEAPVQSAEPPTQRSA